MRRHALVLLAALAVLAPVLAPGAAAAATPVSYQQLLDQIRSGPVIRAIINRPRGDIEIRFKDLLEWESPYPRSAQPMLQRLLHERHIRVLFVAGPHPARSSSTPAHHHLRYIAAAVVAVLLLIAAAAYLRLRRRRAASPPAGAAPGS